MRNRKYRIAIVEDNPAHYRVPIYKEMSKTKEIDFIVYFCSNESRLDRWLFESDRKKRIKIELNGFKYLFLKNYFPFKNIYHPRGLWNFGIISELIKNKYDAVIIYGYSSFSKKMAYFGAKLSGTPIIFREAINEIGGGRVKVFLKKIFYRLLFKLPTAFLPSYTKSKEFYKSFGVPKEKLFLHPVAVDNKLYQGFSEKINKEKVRKRLGIPGNATVFLSVGTIDPRKASFDTLRAFEKLKGKNNYLIFVGEGPYKKKLLEYIENKNMKNVKFFGFNPRPEELSEFYSIANIFIMASIYDPCPKVLNEAMNFSLPIIASTGVGTAFDLVKDRGNGFMYKKRDVTELKKCMEKLLSNEKLMKKMGKESLKIVSKWNFKKDVKATIKALDYIYRKEK